MAGLSNFAEKSIMRNYEISLIAYKPRLVNIRIEVVFNNGRSVFGFFHNNIRNSINFKINRWCFYIMGTAENYESEFLEGEDIAAIFVHNVFKPQLFL